MLDEDKAKALAFYDSLWYLENHELILKEGPLRMTKKSLGRILMKFDEGWLDDEAVNLFVTLLNNYLSSVHAPAANLP